jgi:hypothetical protein
MHFRGAEGPFLTLSGNPAYGRAITSFQQVSLVFRPCLFQPLVEDPDYQELQKRTLEFAVTLTVFFQKSEHPATSIHGFYQSSYPNEWATAIPDVTP